MKQHYSEGDIFCFLLPPGGFGLGVVARKPKGGKILLGYFFGPRLSECSTEMKVPVLSPTSSVRVARFGDLGLINGEWTIIGKVKGWNRESWPFPKFIRINTIIDRRYIVTYPDDLPDGSPSLEQTNENVDEFETDGMFGYGAIEILIDGLLKESNEASVLQNGVNDIEADLSNESRIAQDRIAIEEHVRASRDPLAPTEITFRFYLSTHSSAEKFVDAARKLRYTATSEPPLEGDSPQESAWSVQITLEEVLTPDIMRGA